MRCIGLYRIRGCKADSIGSDEDIDGDRGIVATGDGADGNAIEFMSGGEDQGSRAGAICVFGYVLYGGWKNECC